MFTSRPVAVLAEDEALVRMEAADMLGDLGFDVREADHAAAALVHFEAVEHVDLLYTDVHMPGAFDGCDLAHRVAERWPQTRIIVCSGCPREEAERLPDSAHFIAKPCVEMLVRRALKILRVP